MLENNSHHFRNREFYLFEKLFEVGTKIEDAINNGKIGITGLLKNEKKRNTHVEDQEDQDVNCLSPSSSHNNHSKRNKEGNRRIFTPLDISLSIALDSLVQRGHIKPLKPRNLIVCLQI